MSKSKIISLIKVPIWGFLAMTCISCAHQSNESALMIDSEAPAEMHVWSESKQVDEVVTAGNSTEEAQLDSTEIPVAETTLNQESLALNEHKDTSAINVDDKEINDKEAVESTSLELKAAPPVIVAAQTAKWEDSSTATEDTKEVKSESEVVREVSSEAPADEITAPSTASPIIGAPPKIKTQESAPLRKSKEKNRSIKDTKQSDEKVSINTKAFKVIPIEPTVEIVASAKPVPIEPKTNALGEEEEVSPELASVEIATFIGRHWLAVLITGLCGIVGLYFLVKRNKEDESQTI